MTAVDPQVLYEQLTKGKLHPRKAAGLKIIHEICGQRFNAKATEWGINSIGRESAEREGPTAATLHQPRQEYYRALIRAWEDHARAKHPAERRKTSSGVDDWIQAIDNLASRQLVYALRADLARAQDEIKMLKRLVPSVIAVGGSADQQERSTKPTITVTASQERSAKRFVSGPLSNSQQLKDLGLRTTKQGDLSSESTGEVVLEGPALELLRAAAKLS